MRIAVLSLVILAATAGAATAQTDSPASTPAAAAAKPRDTIAALLSRDEDEPDVAGQPKGAAGPDLDLTSPIPSPTGPPIPFAASPRSQREVPVNVDQTGQTPDGPPDNRAQAYDARIRASFATAQGFQGPLDGGWTLSMRDRDYALQVVDRRDRLEAVWRDLRRTGALDASGLVDDIQRSGGTLTLRIEDPTTPIVVTLRETADGRWTGKATRAGQVLDATLRRTSP